MRDAVMETDNALAFGDWLKRRRKSLDLKQADLAQLVHCSLSTIKRIEQGDLQPSKQLAELMCAALDVPPAQRDAFVRFARSQQTAPADAFTFQPTPLAEAGTGSPPSQQLRLFVPALRARLVGRDDDIVRAMRLLDDSGTRLLTLTGPPGTGKTALALALAAHSQARHTHRAGFVSLAACTEPEHVVSALAVALGIQEMPGQPLHEGIRHAMRDRHALLVLDNFEQVMSAAPLIGEWLAAAPGLTIIVTSREPLRIYGEYEFPVSSLPCPDVTQPVSPKALASNPAVALFVRRAQAVQPNFTLDPANADAVAHICSLLDGLPLALEMAAARMKQLSPQRLVSQLRDQLIDLSAGTRDATPRQRTLRDAIEWSYVLLSEAERQTFERMAVFSGGGEEASALAVVASADAAESLASLCEKSLLRAHPGVDGTRYDMLETLRAYARERLDEGGEAHAVSARHAAHFVALALAAQPQLYESQQGAWLQRLDRELDNLRAALAWCSTNDVEAGLQLATALADYWNIRGLLSEGRAHLEAFLRVADDVAPALRAGALRKMGILAWGQTDHRQAQAALEESLRLYHDLGDRQSIAEMLPHLGDIAFSRSEYARARELYSRSLELSRELGGSTEPAWVLGSLGMIEKDQGDFARASEYYEQSLRGHQQTGDRRAAAWSLVHLGVTAYWQGDFARAAQVTQEGLDIMRDLGVKVGVGYALENLGMATHKLGARERGQALLAESLGIFRELGDQLGVALVLDDLGVIARAQGDAEQAADLHRQSLAIFWQFNDLRRVAFCLEGIAFAMGEQTRAATLLAAADRLRTDIGAPLPPSDQAEFESSLALLRRALGADAFSAAWAHGQAMALDEAVALAR